MGYTIFTFLITLGLFLGMLLLLDLGRRVGIRRRAQDPDGAGAGTGAVDGRSSPCWACSSPLPSRGAASRFDTRGF